MGIGSIGARDGDATRQSVPAWPPCSNGRAGAVPTVGCSSNMTTSWRLTISVGIDEIPAIAISKPYMNTAMMRKPGNMVSTSRSVCVTSIRALRNGVPGNGHAPFWSSSRRSDPPIDCNHHPGGSQAAFLTGLAHLYNLIPYQRRALHAGKCGVEVEGGRVPSSDWILNLQILTSGGYRYAPEPPHH